MTAFDMPAIRSMTRLALPEDNGYIYRLGVALYGFASINSFMTEIITYLDPTVGRLSLLNLTSGEVLNMFRQSAKRCDEPKIKVTSKRAADLFERLNTERSDFVHAYPITSPTNGQILHRRVDAKGKYFEVTNEFLDDFISRLHDVSTALYEIRSIVRPNL